MGRGSGNGQPMRFADSAHPTMRTRAWPGGFCRMCRREEAHRLFRCNRSRHGPGERERATDALRGLSASYDSYDADPDVAGGFSWTMGYHGVSPARLLQVDP